MSGRVVTRDIDCDEKISFAQFLKITEELYSKPLIEICSFGTVEDLKHAQALIECRLRELGDKVAAAGGGAAP